MCFVLGSSHFGNGQFQVSHRVFKNMYECELGLRIIVRLFLRYSTFKYYFLLSIFSVGLPLTLERDDVTRSSSGSKVQKAIGPLAVLNHRGALGPRLELRCCVLLNVDMRG